MNQGVGVPHSYYVTLELRIFLIEIEGVVYVIV